MEPKNYRPVSIISSHNKVLERVVFNQLYKYLTIIDILHSSLYGYRKNRSTLTALYKCMKSGYILPLMVK